MADKGAPLSMPMRGTFALCASTAAGNASKAMSATTQRIKQPSQADGADYTRGR
jgi:hypothetical protein